MTGTESMDTSDTVGSSVIGASEEIGDTKKSNDDEVFIGEKKVAEISSKEYKDTGNKAFKNNDFETAILFYTKAIERAIEKNEQTGAIYNNRAFAHFKLESYGAAVQDATSAIEDNFSKGYYRRGQAKFALMKLDDSLKDFKLAKAKFPKNKDIAQKLKTVKKAIRIKKFEEAIKTENMDVSKTYLKMLQTLSTPKDYTGPVWPETNGNDSASPITREFCMELIEHFKAQKVMSKRHVVRLLLHLTTLFEKLPNITEFETDKNVENSHITVCGDTHGQFYDLLHIFELNGMPSRDNPYLFNGDFVDRGSFSCEVILTMLVFKAYDWDCLHLTRGNHEGLSMNTMYGFKTESDAKYSGVFDLFSHFFNTLPLAYLINKKILVLHGGLFSKDGVKLADIQKLNRFQQIPESGLMCEMLWSDPHDLNGRAPSKRGVGCHFGPDVSKAFLDDNNLDLLIRSHEMKNEGYEWQHGKRVLTVFSAPNYVDTMGNKGAFVRIGNDGVKGIKITEFSSVPHPKVQSYMMNQQSIFQQLMGAARS
jgi:serine/threonine-protein phosphatase 5